VFASAVVFAAGENQTVLCCEFRENKPQVEIGAAVRQAVVTENLIKGILRVANNSSGATMIKSSASDDAKP